MRAKPCGEHSEGFFFSQRHYRAGLATRPPNLSLAAAYVAGDELLSMVHEARGVSPAVVVASSIVATSKASWG